MVSTLDLFPTLVGAAGARLPDGRRYDGSDLIARLARAPGQAREPLYWRTQPMHAMREGDWKYLKDLDGAEYLYRLTDDPRELRNRAIDEGARLAEMRERYGRWEAEMVAPRWAARSVEFSFDERRFRFTP